MLSDSQLMFCELRLMFWLRVLCCSLSAICGISPSAPSTGSSLFALVAPAKLELI